MGSTCFCGRATFMPEIKLNQIPLRNENELEAKDSKDTKLAELKSYFEENEKDLIMKKPRKIGKKRVNKKLLKKGPTLLNPTSEKYEQMLKGLLEQKKLKKIGPKRRVTIRKGEFIKCIIDEVIEENKDKKNEVISSCILEVKNKFSKHNSLLMKNNHDIQKGLSEDKISIGIINIKNPNKVEVKKKKNQNILDNKTINEDNNSYSKINSKVRRLSENNLNKSEK